MRAVSVRRHAAPGPQRLLLAVGAALEVELRPRGRVYQCVGSSPGSVSTAAASSRSPEKSPLPEGERHGVSHALEAAGRQSLFPTPSRTLPSSRARAPLRAPRLRPDRGRDSHAAAGRPRRRPRERADKGRRLQTAHRQRRPRAAHPEWRRGRSRPRGRRAGRARNSGWAAPTSRARVPPARCQGEAFTNRPSYSVVPAEAGTQSDVLEAGRDLEGGGRVALETLDGLAPSPCSRLRGNDGGAGRGTEAGSRVKASPYQRPRGDGHLHSKQSVCVIKTYRPWMQCRVRPRGRS